jgi:hypothetical protein
VIVAPVEGGEVSFIGGPKPFFFKDFTNFIHEQVTHEYMVLESVLFGALSLMAYLAKIE